MHKKKFAEAREERKLCMLFDSLHTFAASFDFLVDSQRRDVHIAAFEKSVRAS